MCEPVSGTTILYAALIGGGIGGGMGAMNGGGMDGIARGVILGAALGAATAGIGNGIATGLSNAPYGFHAPVMAGITESSLATYGSWGMMGATTLMSISGQQQAAQSAAAMANYQSQVAGYNMQVAQQQADFTQQDVDRELLERKRSLTRFTGQQRSLLAGAGVELSGGTPLNLLADTEAMGQRDIQRTARMGQRNVWAAQTGVQQQQFSTNKGMMSAQAGASQRSFKMGTTLLSSGGSLLKSFPVTS
jgi:hypothetical protein